MTLICKTMPFEAGRAFIATAHRILRIAGRRRLAALLGVLLVMAPAGWLHAETFPSRPVTLVVGYPPGGSTDKLARLLAQAMQERLGQQVIIDNRAGAAGNVAAQYVAQAQPNGYTLYMATLSSQAINPWLYENVGFDPLKDLAPVAFVAAYPLVLAMAPSLPPTSVADALGYIRQNSGKVFFASAGTGSPGHLSGELFKSSGKVSMTHVPYKGGAPAMFAVMSGEATLAIETIPAMVPFIKGGKLKGLAVTSAKRSSALPQLPTLAESGMEGFDLTSWAGIVAPARTPPAVLHKLEEATLGALRDPKLQAALAADGAEVRLMPAEEFRKFQEREQAKWKEIVRLAELRKQ